MSSIECYAEAANDKTLTDTLSHVKELQGQNALGYAEGINPSNDGIRACCPGINEPMAVPSPQEESRGMHRLTGLNIVQQVSLAFSVKVLKFGVIAIVLPDATLYKINFERL